MGNFYAAYGFTARRSASVGIGRHRSASDGIARVDEIVYLLQGSWADFLAEKCCET